MQERTSPIKAKDDDVYDIVAFCWWRIGDSPSLRLGSAGAVFISLKYR